MRLAFGYCECVRSRLRSTVEGWRLFASTGILDASMYEYVYKRPTEAQHRRSYFVRAKCVCTKHEVGKRSAMSMRGPEKLGYSDACIGMPVDGENAC